MTAADSVLIGFMMGCALFICNFMAVKTAEPWSFREYAAKLSFCGIFCAFTAWRIFSIVTNANV